MHLYAIPPDHPFLDILAAGLIARLGRDGLAAATILLPTRRAARGLRAACLRAALPAGADGALLLPRFRALAGLSTEDAEELALPALLDLPPAVTPLRRQAVLAELIRQLPPRHGGPTTPEQAWSLATALATLLDEIALEEHDLDLLAATAPAAFAEAWLARLAALVPEQHATHWQITIRFLRGVVAEWHGFLTGASLLDVGLARVLALRAQAAAWLREPPATPVIAAGIGAGGTIPAAAALLRVVAGLPRGAVVLPGAIGAPPAWRDAIRAQPAHPDCGLLRLLAALRATPEDCRPWTPTPAAAGGRSALVGLALCPAEGLPAWQRRGDANWAASLGGLSLLVAPEPQAEAVGIALLLREALERPAARVALVTPDRDLAARVAAELARYGIVADDSAGQELGQTPTGAFLRLLAAMAAAELAPIPLLAVLKHPLCAAGFDRADWLGRVRRLEAVALRGARPGPGIAGLRAAIVADDQDGALAELLDALATALGGFTALPDGPPRPPAALLAELLAAAEALATTADRPGGLRLYAGEEGEPLALHLAALAEALTELGPIAPAAWPALFDAALAGGSAPSLVASRGRPTGVHPRVEILGLLEARLLGFDRVVLGALDETIWPLATDPGPWMSRSLRRDFGLPEPETRIGRVAADFAAAAAAAPEIVLTRSRRRGGQPTVPARWLTRLETFLQGQGLPGLPISPAAEWAAQLDRPTGPVRPAPRPAPRPPAAARPDRLSVTEVEALVADPYAFYAKRVLRLRRLDPIDQEAGAADYGSLVHAAMAGFVQALGPGWPGEDAARAAFAAAADAALAKAGVRPGLCAFWRPRIERIGAFAVAQEASLRSGQDLRDSHTEVTGRLALRHRDGRVVTLTVRADRIDRLASNRLAIIDYKTGAPPSLKRVKEGHHPQLTLEAAIAAAGGFAGLDPARAERLVYWQLSGGDPPGTIPKPIEGAQEIAGLADAALDATRRLAARFLWGDAAFIARPHPARDPADTGYDHLSRLAEWADAPAPGGPA